MVVIHFLPIEKYPPILNLLDNISLKKGIHKPVVITTRINNQLELYKNENIKIIRFKSVNPTSGFRLVHYLAFYLGALLRIIFIHPSKILWFETLSSFPAIVYYYLRLRKPQLLVHYHEYMSPEEINKGMMLVRLFHEMEKIIYPKITWLSHTNKYRMDLFIKDHPSVKLEKTQVLPNYPPKWWNNYSRCKLEYSNPVKLVYVGSFASFDTIYIKEIVEWLKNNSNKFILDIYSFEIPDAIVLFCDQPNINIKGAIKNSRLPEILSEYDIGLILYKAKIDNVVFCAPNKLFEYLACGLDVWYPHVMLGSHPYQNSLIFPKVIEVDFDNLSDFDWKSAVDRENLTYNPSTYFAEDVYQPLLNLLSSGNN